MKKILCLSFCLVVGFSGLVYGSSCAPCKEKFEKTISDSDKKEIKEMTKNLSTDEKNKLKSVFNGMSDENKARMLSMFKKMSKSEKDQLKEKLENK